jgi:Spherulation-specific family 4
MRLFNLPLTLPLLILSIPHILAAFITFPIYIGPSPTAWAPLYTAISSTPQVLFQLIINPNSGPGNGVYPSWNYIQALSKLRTYPNVQLIGYAHISYCSRAINLVEADVATYANWSTYSNASAKIAVNGIHLDGIFFDEAPESYTASDFSYLTNITTYARSLFPGGGHLNLNPGILCDSRYFPLVDTINVWEDSYSHFNTKTAINVIPTAERSKSTVIIYSFTGNTNTQKSLVSEIASAGVAGMFVTTTEYESFSKYWTQFVADVAATV